MIGMVEDNNIKINENGGELKYYKEYCKKKYKCYMMDFQRKKIEIFRRLGQKTKKGISMTNTRDTKDNSSFKKLN